MFVRLVVILMLFILTSCGSNPITSVYDDHIASMIQRGDYVNIRFEQQLNNKSCGAAVLASVLKYWHIEINQARILDQFPPKSNNRGYSLGELKNISRQFGLHAFAIQGNTKLITEQLLKGRPSIILLKVDQKYLFNDSKFLHLLAPHTDNSLRHYVVFLGAASDLFWLMDPVFGIRSVKQHHFEHMWDNSNHAALLITK